MSNIIRLAEETDNEQILALSKRCPQKGMITFYPSRSPVFNKIHRLIDPSSWHLVSCSDKIITGLVGVVNFENRFEKTFHKMAYMLDLKVDPEYRNGITAFKLLKTADVCLRDSDVEIMMVNFLKNNKLPLVFTTGRGGLPESLYLGDNRIYNMISLRFLNTDDRFIIEEPTKDDIPEMVKVYNCFYSNYKLAPVMSKGKLEYYNREIEGLSLDNFLVAREDGKIKAIVAAWDELPYKSYVVQKLNFSIKMITVLVRFLSLFIRVPKRIELNKPLRQLSLVLFAHDNCPEALITLFRHLNNINLGGEYSMMSLVLQKEDTLFKYLKGFAGISVHTEIHLFAKDRKLLERIQKNPALVISDLATLI